MNNLHSQRVIAIHLNNDWSGSPLIFRQALMALQRAGFSVFLFAGSTQEGGFLSDIPSIVVHSIPYRWSESKLRTLFIYSIAQVYLFIRLLFLLKRSDRVYINTLLPFGAALAGWLRGCLVIYHIHEVSIRPKLLRTWLKAVANFTSKEALFVSEFTLKQTNLSRPQSHRIYNSLSESFTSKAASVLNPEMISPFTALMICSNKLYKGTQEFVNLARQLPHIKFLLVLNATDVEVKLFNQSVSPPINCLVYPSQADTVPFYQRAHVILNLSNPAVWVETFGMTILEAITCGRPVITPTVGGVCELIEDGQEGFRIDSSETAVLVKALRQLSSDLPLYLRMARAARQRSRFFSQESFDQQLIEIFKNTNEVLVPVHKMEPDSKIRNRRCTT